MASTRLPAKVLCDLAGKPMLVRVVERLKKTKMVDSVIVATTREESDTPIEALCEQQDYPYYRGSFNDVLDRFYQAARLVKADVIVRITADCPVLDPGLVDETVQAFLGEGSAPKGVDFAANRLPPPLKRTYPIGLDTEVCSFQVLEKVWQEADQAYHREHVMPFLYEGIRPVQHLVKTNAPGYWDLFTSQRGFQVLLLNYDKDYSSYRWTVDTPSDLTLIQRIYEHFGGRDDFGWLEVLDFVNQNPELSKINQGTYHKDFHESERDPK